jgi:tripartite-type tricarboxylate transporter receptor subunit TctC
MLKTAFIGAVVLWCGLGTTASAQTYPSRAVTIVVPHASAGAADVVTRVIANGLQNETGQSFVIENRAGASGTIGVQKMLSAPPDGYTLLLIAASTTLAGNPTFIKNLSFDPIKDLQPISMVGNIDNVLVVSPTLPVNNTLELIQLAKAKPGVLNYAATGLGSSGHMNMELFKRAANINLVNVHYKAATQATSDLAAGRVDAWITPIPAALPMIKAGKIKALGVTGTTRSSLLAGVPMVAETPGLRGFEAQTLYALFARTGTPKASIDKINSLVKQLTATPEIKAQMERSGVEAVWSEPDAVRDMLIRYIAKWSDLVKATGMSIE